MTIDQTYYSVLSKLVCKAFGGREIIVMLIKGRRYREEEPTILRKQQNTI